MAFPWSAGDQLNATDLNKMIEPVALFVHPNDVFTVYSDDWANVPWIRTTLITNGVYLNQGPLIGYDYSVKYLAGNKQYIAGTTLWANADGGHGFMVQGGYLYWFLYDTGTHTAKIYRASTASDISQAGNWEEITISGDTLSDTEDYLVGYGDGKFWICDNGTKYKTYTLSGTTLTYVADITVAGAEYDADVDRVNDSGIICNWSSAPYFRVAGFDGTLNGKQVGDTTSTKTFASRFNFYSEAPSYSSYTAPWVRVDGI